MRRRWVLLNFFFFFNDTATTEIYTLSLHDALPISSCSTPLNFVPSEVSPDLGTLEMELENTEFIINDGQHRCAAIAAALKENPAIGKDKISVLLFATENLERLQQMFSDLNRFAHKTSKSLDILYDHRDNLSALTMEVSQQVSVVRGMIDKERITNLLRSPKLFTLDTPYDASLPRLGGRIAAGPPGDDAVKPAMVVACGSV